MEWGMEKESNMIKMVYIYEWEFKDGQRDGKGKLFVEEGKIIYEGKFISRLRKGETRSRFECSYGYLNLLNGLFDC